MIHLYIYSTKNGAYLRSDMGSPDYIFIDLSDNEDFTLTAPPDSEHQWRWINDKWTADDTAN